MPLDLLAPEILSISADLRKIAVVIIMIRAGLALDTSDLLGGRRHGSEKVNSHRRGVRTKTWT